MQEKIKKGLLFSSLLLFGSTTMFGVYFTERVSRIRKKSSEEIYNREKQLGHIDEQTLQALPKEELRIPSPHGYMISALAITPHETNKYMIFSHGVTENKLSSMKYANLFLKRGFNTVIYDQRRHGNTGGNSTSYGFYEKDDLRAIVQWLRKTKGEVFLGIHGESMGAATTLLYAAENKNGADFYIVDCPFSDLKELLTYRIECEMKWIPAKLILPIGNLFLKLRDKYGMEDVSPLAVIEQIEEPILFIHSKKDDYILPYMTEELYQRKKGPKMLFLAENGAHAQSLNENRSEYEAAIDHFLKQYVFCDTAP